MCKRKLPGVATPAFLLAGVCLAAGAPAAEPRSAEPTRSGPSLDGISVDPDTGFLRDSRGRVRIFHGVNVVYKEAPWYPPSGSFTPDDSLDGETMDLLREWGFNVVRLGVMWPGVEPVHGAVDHGYLASLLDLTAELGKRGVYTIADLHQDVGLRRFCGEGFPEFYGDLLASDPESDLSKAATFPSPLPFAMPVNGSGVPALADCLKHQFAGYYITEKVGAVWRSLYTPGSALNDGFARFWGAVAGRFAGHPQVLGYELLNEPSGFCLGRDGDCLRGGQKIATNEVERRYLMPLYRLAAAAIRAVDSSTIIMAEPVPEPKATDETFPGPPLGSDPQQAFAYHIYCAPGDGASYPAELLCRVTQDLYTMEYYGFLRKHKGLAGFLTEFGAVGGNPKELNHMSRLLDFTDSMFHSWTYWMLKRYRDFTTANSGESLYDDDGNLNVPKLKTLSRTYAQAIAGIPIKMVFDHQSAAFDLVFNATLPGETTDIYLNQKLHYPDGFVHGASDCLNMSRQYPNHLEFVTRDTPDCVNTVVGVHIQPAARKPPSNFII